MWLSVVSTCASNMNVTLRKFSQKKIFLPGSPTFESDEEMSPLSYLSDSSSSSLSLDGYTSPPSTYTTQFGKPIRKVCGQSVSDWPSSKTGGPESRLCLFELCASSGKKLPLNKSQDSREQHKGKFGSVTNTELVEESPMRGPTKMVLLSPFKCLAGKDKQNEMPKQKPKKLVFEESADIVSATAPVKALQKPNPDYVANTVQTNFHAFTVVNKLKPIPPSSFYPSSRARAAAFPEPSSASRNTIYSVTGMKKNKRSYSRIFSPSSSKRHLAKRRKVGEINAGVYHMIKKCKKKLKYKLRGDTAQCKIMPEDGIQSYLEKVVQSSTDTKNSVNNEKAVHLTPRHGVQPRPRGSRMKSLNCPLTPNTVELICPASPPPYLDKVAHSISDTQNSVYSGKGVQFTLRHGVQPCLTGSRMKSSSSRLTSNTVELTCPASPPPDPRRKFFKFPRVRKSKRSATVNKNIKLVSFCSFKYTGQLNLMSKYENCPNVICNVDCKLSSLFPRIITRLHECY